MDKVLLDKKLLSLKEVCDYLNIGQSKARQIRKDREVLCGHRLFKIDLD